MQSPQHPSCHPGDPSSLTYPPGSYSDKNGRKLGPEGKKNPWDKHGNSEGTTFQRRAYPPPSCHFKGGGKVKKPTQDCPTFILQLATHQVSINTVVRTRHLSPGQHYTQKQREEA